MTGVGERVPATVGEYLAIVGKHWILVAVCTVLVGGTAALYSALAIPQYRATTTMYVSVRASESTASVSDLTQGSSYARQAVLSYAAVIESEIVLSPTIEELGLAEQPEELATQVEATSPSDSVLITVAVTRPDPSEAADIANSLARNFSQVVEEVIEAPAQEGQSPVRITTIQVAKPPSEPVSPRVALNVALGVIVGLLLGLGAALVRDSLDTRLRTGDDARRVLGLPVLGEIRRGGRRPGTALVALSDPNSASAEDYRRLRTNLQFVNLDGQPHSFLVTSSGRNEGKSTVACNLAITLARTDAKVVLVDGDMRNPTVAACFGLDNSVGLSTVLAKLVPVEDALLVSGGEGLAVLPAGRTPPNPSELLSSNEMARVHSSLTDRFDYVVIDSPPVLAVTDAAVLSGIVGTTILVAQAGRTRKNALLDSLAALHGIAKDIGGIVLTGATPRERESYGYRQSPVRNTAQSGHRSEPGR